MGVEDGAGASGAAAAQLAKISELQQKVAADDIALHRAVRVVVEEELGHAAGELTGLSTELPEQLVVNGAGDFEVGGSEAEAEGRRGGARGDPPDVWARAKQMAAPARRLASEDHGQGRRGGGGARWPAANRPDMDHYLRQRYLQ